MSVIELAPAAAEIRLWPAVWKLLRLRWLITWSGFRRASRGRKFWLIVLGLVLLGVLGGMFAVAWLVLDAIRSDEVFQVLGDMTSLIESIPALMLTGVFIGILMTSFGLLLQGLYLAGDMEFLLSKPVPIRAVFITKLIQAILPNFGLVSLIGLPVLAGLGSSSGFNLLYYPLAFVLLCLLALVAAGLASLLVMAVVRLFPARRVAEVLGFVVAIVSFTCSQTGNLMNFGGGDITEEQALQAFSLVRSINTPWSPLTWAGRSLIEVGQGNLLGGLALFVLVAAVAGGIFYGCLTAAERLYYSGWAKVQVSVKPRKPARRTTAPQFAGLNDLVGRLISAPVRAMLVKDLLMLRRDLRNMAQLVTPLIFGLIYGFILVRNAGQTPAGRGEAPEAFMQIFGTFIAFGNVSLALFVGWSLLSRLASLGFSQEGRSYWLLKTAPVSAARLLAAKFLVAYLPSLILSWALCLVLGIVQQPGWLAFFYSLAVVAFSLAGLAGMLLAFGVAGANFDWDDPRRISQGTIGCLGALASFIYLLFSLGFFLGPLALVGFFPALEPFAYGVGLLLGGGLGVTLALVPPWLVRARVDRLNE